MSHFGEEEQDQHSHLPRLARVAHAGHVKRCLSGLPDAQVDLDSSRLAIVFYCLGTLDLLGLIPDKVSENDIEMWKEWIWEQHVSSEEYGAGFRGSTFMNSQAEEDDMPNVIMTYTGILSLAILRDGFERLDKWGLVRFLRACQRGDGSFSATPVKESGTGEEGRDMDLRTLYCAFVICSLLDDWSGIDLDKALEFVGSCRTYEGGYGISTNTEAQGGSTYIALASIYLAPSSPSLPNRDRLTPTQISQTISWLLKLQHPSGGFCGRTNKVTESTKGGTGLGREEREGEGEGEREQTGGGDACYCFWCGAGLKILGADHLVNTPALLSFIADCQFKFGGIAKAPGEHPDPYHTYLSLASLAMYTPFLFASSSSTTTTTTTTGTTIGDSSSSSSNSQIEAQSPNRATWIFDPLDPLINAREETARWAREKVAIRS